MLTFPLFAFTLILFFTLGIECISLPAAAWKKIRAYVSLCCKWPIETRGLSMFTNRIRNEMWGFL